MRILAIVLLMLSGAASAQEIALSRLDSARKIVPPKFQVVEDEAPRARYPKVWYPIEESVKPKQRNEALWAQDGYLFKYSF